MKCLSCGSSAAFARFIIDTEADTKEGRLCSSCEYELLEPRLRKADTDDHASECLECNGDGVYAVPEIDLAVDDELQTPGVLYEYELTASTPRFCKSHLEALLQEPRRIDPLNMLEERIQ